MYNLFLDDIRMPYEVGNYIYPVDLRKQFRLEEWVIVRSYKEFVDVIIEKGLPKKVSFDHDLADIHYDPIAMKESFSYYEETGYDCAVWLCEYCMDNNKDFPDYYIHSWNDVGRENIKSYIENFIKNR